jgi:hypothetical protein
VADSLIANLDAAAPLTGTELLPGDQSGNDVKITTQDVADLAAPGGTFPNFTGSGSPEGSQTATEGQSYYDSTNGGLYVRPKGVGTGDTNWLIVGGYSPDDVDGNGIVGLGSTSNGNLAFLARDGGDFVISDTGALIGSGNGIYYSNIGSDGDQRILIDLGPAADYEWQFNADGTTELPGDLTVDGDISADNLFPDYSGSGSPEGVQTATVGKSYVDTDTGLVWQYGGVDGQDSPWSANALGVIAVTGDTVNFVSDYDALYDPGGTGNALYWDSSGGDGAQSFFMQLGSSGQFATNFNADGTTELPGATRAAGAIGTSAGEPADGDIGTGECFRWFDDTAGTPLIRFKAKDAAGDLFEATVAMTPIV